MSIETKENVEDVEREIMAFIRESHSTITNALSVYARRMAEAAEEVAEENAVVAGAARESSERAGAVAEKLSALMAELWEIEHPDDGE